MHKSDVTTRALQDEVAGVHSLSGGGGVAGTGAARDHSHDHRDHRVTTGVVTET